MKTSSVTKTHDKMDPVLRRWMIAVVCLLCMGLLGSAFYTYATLSRMRAQFLSNRGHEIAAALEMQARGPGKRNNPAFWQSLFDENYEMYSGKVAFLALLDPNGNQLAGKGDSSPGLLNTADISNDGIYRFEEQLGRSRNRQGVANPSVVGWRIQIGLRSADADFIRRAAFMQLALSGMAVLVLVGLLVFLVSMLDRFAEMKARENAEAQLRSLGVMAASLAHEIRNPLGAIKGLTQLAQEELPMEHATQGQLKTVVAEAERLEELVSGLLDFARPREPQQSEFNVAELLSGIRTMLQSKLADSGVDLQCKCETEPLPMRSDPAGLRQVLLNVCINSIDASPRGSTVLLKAIREQGKGFIEFQIDDEGQGIGDRDPEEFFEPFITTKARGTGLGLAISRRIVARLGGTVALKSNPQGGARCTLRLPVGM